jgi:hypothetical protein
MVHHFLDGAQLCSLNLFLPKDMNVISFDIGTKNLAYVVITSDNKLYFKLINLDGRVRSEESKTVGRCRVLTEIMNEAISLTTLFPIRVVIEKQVRANITAMGLMYSLLSLALTYTEDVIEFAPNQKFILLNQQFTTAKKAHKALAIQMTKDLLSKYYPDKLSEFNKIKKKDDIADSFLMAYLSK